MIMPRSHNRSLYEALRGNDSAVNLYDASACCPPRTSIALIRAPTRSDKHLDSERNFMASPSVRTHGRNRTGGTSVRLCVVSADPFTKSATGTSMEILADILPPCHTINRWSRNIVAIAATNPETRSLRAFLLGTTDSPLIISVQSYSHHLVIIVESGCSACQRAAFRTLRPVPNWPTPTIQSLAFSPDNGSSI